MNPAKPFLRVNRIKGHGSKPIVCDSLFEFANPVQKATFKTYLLGDEEEWPEGISGVALFVDAPGSMGTPGVPNMIALGEEDFFIYSGDGETHSWVQLPIPGGGEGFTTSFETGSEMGDSGPTFRGQIGISFDTGFLAYGAAAGPEGWVSSFSISSLASTTVATSSLSVNGHTVTVTGPFSISGGYTVSLIASAATSVTLPTSGILATRAGTETLTNKTINGANNTITNVSLATGVTGTLPVLNGGTGSTTAAGARVNLDAAQGKFESSNTSLKVGDTGGTALGAGSVNIQATRTIATQVALGASAVNVGNSGLAQNEAVNVGADGKASDTDATNVGYMGTALFSGTSIGAYGYAAEYAVNIGMNGSALQGSGINIGSYGVSNGTNAVNVGLQGQANADCAINVGPQGQAQGFQSCQFGYGGVAAYDGQNVNVGAFGYAGGGCVNVGYSGNASGTNNTNVGLMGSVNGACSASFGYAGQVSGSYAVSVGSKGVLTANYTTQIAAPSTLETMASIVRTYGETGDMVFTVQMTDTGAYLHGGGLSDIPANSLATGTARWRIDSAVNNVIFEFNYSGTLKTVSLPLS